MLFIMKYIYNFFDIIKEKFCSSNKDKYEQEYINFNIYDKTIIIKNDINDINDINKSLIIDYDNIV